MDMDLKQLHKAVKISERLKQLDQEIIKLERLGYAVCRWQQCGYYQA